jgi:transposase
MDEARFGLKSWHRRRWCPRGRRPPWVVEDRYEWLWLYAAVEPCSGQSFFLLLPCLDSRCFALFVKGLRRRYRRHRVGVVLDNSPSHTSHRVAWPRHMLPLRLPPYSPELNPVERFFKELRRRLANRIFASLESLERVVIRTLHHWQDSPRALSQLTFYPWWRDGLQAIQTL